MIRRTKEDAQATRDAILDAAELMFHRQGVSRTSLSDVAQAAGVTRGAIYWHFKDKADLFHAMMERAILPMEASEATISLNAQGLPPLQRLRQSAILVLHLVAGNARMRRVFEIATLKVEYVDELISLQDRHTECQARCLAKAESELRAARAQSHLASTAPPLRTLALGLQALTHGLMQIWLLAPTSFDLVRVGTQAIDTYLTGMLAAPADGKPSPLHPLLSGCPPSPRRRVSPAAPKTPKHAATPSRSKLKSPRSTP